MVYSNQSFETPTKNWLQCSTTSSSRVVLRWLCVLASWTVVATSSQQSSTHDVTIDTISIPQSRWPQQGLDELWLSLFDQRRQQEALRSTGFYYGITSDVVASLVDEPNSSPKIRTPRRKRKSKADLLDDRQVEFDAIGKDVEEWAQGLLGESGKEKHGWAPVECNKAFLQKFNANGGTKQYVKWMSDSRGKHANLDDAQKVHPCMKLYATIDAPLDMVCDYLSQDHRYPEYNSLIIDQRDVEEITPHSKICWSQTKKLMFIQPRDFVTFCHHRWLRDDTQVVVSQACDHPTFQKGDGLRAYAIRGATFISRDPMDPKGKTKMVMLAHANCGQDIPEWAVRTAVGVLAPIKPFEIVYRINKGVKRAQADLERQMEERTKSVARGGRSSRPAGIAQMGYGCFWPQGGGLVD